MNSKFFRLVFSKTRGMLVAVAEFAHSHRADSSSGSVKKVTVKKIGQLSAVSFGLLLAMGAVHTAHANVVADASASAGLQPGISNTPYGATQVDIQAPSAAGVSRNVYSQFDVGQQGVILNNSQNGAWTQLGGEIQGNAALAQGAAKIILNEVNSANASQLNGYVEVAGQNAQVIIANPSGITCDGCGFINANRATLTTGQAQLENGALTGYKVQGGEIVVQGNGMDSSSQDFTDIIARTVKVNGFIQANDLRITTGLNQVDAANQQVTKLDSSSADSDTLALDVSSLGGMYAGKITLIGTEKGVGVNNAGSVYSSAGDVVINTDGNISNSGDIVATSNAVFTTNQTLTNTGNLSADGNIQLTAATLHSQSNSAISAGGDVTLKGSELAINGSGINGRNVTLNASKGAIDSSGATINAVEKLTLTSNSVNNQQGFMRAENITIDTGELDNSEGEMAGSGSINLTASKIKNTSGNIASNGDINITASKAVVNTAGYIYGTGNITINSDSDVINDEMGNIYSSAKAEINAAGMVNNSGLLQGNQVTVNAASVTNEGDINANENLALNSTGHISHSGNLFAGKDLSVNAASLNSSAESTMLAGMFDYSGNNHLSLNTTGKLIANGSANLYGYGTLTLQGEELDLSGSQLTAMDINLDAGKGNLNTSAAVIAAEQNINIVSTGMNNQQGSISGRDTTIKTAELNNEQGSIIGYESLVSDSQSLNNESGQLESSNMLSINTNGKAFNNHNGRVSGQTIDVKSGDINNQNGMIYALDKVSLSGAEINNNNGIIHSGSLTDINANSLSNEYGTVLGQDVSIAASTIDNTTGTIAAESSLTLKADEINNQSGALNGNVITLTSDVLKNESGTVAANTKLDMSVKDSQNDNGLISVGGVDINYDGTSAPVIDVTDDSAFWAWNDSVNDVYRQVTSSFPKISLLPEIMNYMYKILASGNEINSEIIKQLALQSWGFGYTEENISTISKIADIMTTAWHNPSEAQGGASQPDNGDTLVPDSDDQSAGDIADASLPLIDLTDSTDFWTWTTSVGGSEFYQQLINSGIPGIKSAVMPDVLNYMYKVLVNGGVITDEMLRQLAGNVWGLASSQEHLDAIGKIAESMAASLN